MFSPKFQTLHIKHSKPFFFFVYGHHVSLALSSSLSLSHFHMKQNHCTPDLSEFPGGLQKIFIRTLYIKHKLRDSAEHNTLMGEGVEEEGVGGAVTQNNNAHAQVAKEP